MSPVKTSRDPILQVIMWRKGMSWEKNPLLQWWIHLYHHCTGGPPVPDTDSFRLVLEPDSQEDDELLDTVLGGSQVDKKSETPRASRLALLRSKFDVTQLEQSLDLTPKIGLARCGDDIILEEKKEPTLSSGAEKLFRRLISHQSQQDRR